jgi:hypothetical protein
MTIVAIHQPNFFPWLGYFAKIARSDVFVFLDHVQFPKTGGIWSNRVKLLAGGEARWVTAPVERAFHGVRAVNKTEFQSSTPWRKKFWKTLVANYARAPFFRETAGFLEPLILNSENNLSRYNSSAVIAIAHRLELPSEKFRWSSEIEVNGQSNELLISLTRAVGGNAYMCGGGATEYQDEGIFAAAGIRLVHQDFKHPVYEQHSRRDFVPGLSIIDAFMCCGFSEVRRFLNAISR